MRVRSGSRDIKCRIGPDKNAAQAVAAKLEQEIALAAAANQPWTGLEPARSRVGKKTLAEAAQEFLEERTHRKPSTIASYQTILKTNLLPKFGRLPPPEITEGMIAKWQAQLAAKISPSRVNTIMQVLRSIMAIAHRRGEIVRNPCAGIPNLRRNRTKVDPLSESELQEVIPHIEYHFRPLFICLAYTGARPNELLALRWSDVDWRSKTISITKVLVRGKEGPPKTPSSERTIPILPPAEEALLDQKSHQIQQLAGYVFTDRNGRPIRKHLARILARVLRKAGLRHRPSYELRHTFASLCLLKASLPATSPNCSDIARWRRSIGITRAGSKKLPANRNPACASSATMRCMNL